VEETHRGSKNKAQKKKKKKTRKSTFIDCCHMPGTGRVVSAEEIALTKATSAMNVRKFEMGAST